MAGEDVPLWIDQDVETWGGMVSVGDAQQAIHCALARGWRGLYFSAIYESDGAYIQLRGDRLETPKEVEDRLSAYKFRAAQERKEYERLKQKFEGTR